MRSSERGHCIAMSFSVKESSVYIMRVIACSSHAALHRRVEAESASWPKTTGKDWKGLQAW